MRLGNSPNSPRVTNTAAPKENSRFIRSVWKYMLRDVKLIESGENGAVGQNKWYSVGISVRRLEHNCKGLA